jgi:hypothetical protein
MVDRRDIEAGQIEEREGMRGWRRERQSAENVDFWREDAPRMLPIGFGENHVTAAHWGKLW